MIGTRRALAHLAAVALVTGLTLRATTQDALADGAEKKKPKSDEAGDKDCCKGKNECKGQGNCKTDKNECKGQNDCKGQGGCQAPDCAGGGE